MTRLRSRHYRRCTGRLALSAILFVGLSAGAQASLIGDEVRIQIGSVDTTFIVAKSGPLADYSFSSFNWNVEKYSINFWIGHVPNGSLASNVSFTLSDLDFSTGVELVDATIVSAEGLFVDAPDNILTVDADSIVVDLSSFGGGSLEGVNGMEIELVVESCPSVPRTNCVAARDASLTISERTLGYEKLKVELGKLAAKTKPSKFGNPVKGITSYAVCIYDEADTLVDELSLGRAGDFCGVRPNRKACWKTTASGYKFKDPDAATDGFRNFLIKSGPKKKGKLILTAGNNASKNQSALRLGLTAALAGTSKATVHILTSHGRCFGAKLTDVRRAAPLSFKAR
jgi:hypothetical protein